MNNKEKEENARQENRSEFPRTILQPTVSEEAASLEGRVGGLLSQSSML
jgi:hypothetical protein